MKFKVGDEVFQDFVTLDPVKIVRVFEKTRRYEVQSKSKSGYDGRKIFVNERDIYLNREEYIKNKLREVNHRIEEYTSQKERYEEELCNIKLRGKR